MALPQVEQVTDFHCVTTWSRMDNHWRGVRFQTIEVLAEDHKGFWEVRGYSNSAEPWLNDR